ncbi:hypothetical protein [Nocardia sp. BSTN01]|uniref:hypothetical protein n=1 Tax=Nocardia sp. BSTN01 TaxID=2783665 RepID=UPI001E4C5CE0|nr:hypothetical protein [Nocardia sp. BSTN01]
MALNRPLDAAQQAEARALSTRARITDTSFVNEHHWRAFGGDPSRVLERVLDLDAVDRFQLDEHVTAWTLGRHAIIELSTEQDDEPDWTATPSRGCPKSRACGANSRSATCARSTWPGWPGTAPGNALDGAARNRAEHERREHTARLALRAEQQA